MCSRTDVSTLAHNMGMDEYALFQRAYRAYGDYPTDMPVDYDNYVSRGTVPTYVTMFVNSRSTPRPQTGVWGRQPQAR